MNTHNHGDIVEEAAVALGPWQTFLAARRAEIEAQIAQLQASPVAASVVPTMTTPVILSPATAPPSLATEAEETEVAGRAEALAVTRKPHENTSTPPGTAEAEGLEESTGTVPPIPLPTTLAEAEAHFEATLAGVNPATLPAKVREAHQERVRDPQRFAEVLVGAKEQGYLPTALEGVVDHMTRFDPHFRQAQTLYEDGGYAALFEIGAEEDDGFRVAEGNESNEGEEDIVGEDEDEPEEDGAVEADRAARQRD